MSRGTLALIQRFLAMTAAGSRPIRKGLFATFRRSIIRQIRRLRPAGNSLYRPEKHYMRGAGPKSKSAAESRPARARDMP